MTRQQQPCADCNAGGSRHPISRWAWRATTPKVTGDPYRLHGYELLQDHPLLRQLGPCADLVSTADDRPLPYASYLEAELTHPYCH